MQMKAWFQKAGLNNTSIFVLLLLRMVVVLFSVVLALKTDTPSEQYIDVILLGFGIYHLLAVCIYWPAMMTPVPRLLLSVSDLLIIQAAVVLTGSVTSPFLLCVFIPVFTLHFVYGWRGLAGGLLGLLLSTAACLYAVRAFLPLNLNREGVNTSLIVLGISLTLFYLIPFLALTQYTRVDNQLRSLKERYHELDSINSKLLVLYEMTGRFNYENGIAHVMDRLLALCGEVFPAQRVCIFLIRSGEVEVYGKPTAQEKEDIYRLIMEQKKTGEAQEREYVLRQDALMIPLIRGARTDGVLSFNGWTQKEITGREAVLFSMVANMLCTYLENLEYVEALKSKLQPDTCIILNHLDSGRLVKGVLDKRIVQESLK
jgi:hypothetical protein